MASSGWRPGTLLIIPQCMGRTPQQRTIAPQVAGMCVRNPGSGIFCRSEEHSVMMFIYLFLYCLFRMGKTNALSEFSSSFGKHLFIPHAYIWAPTVGRRGAGCLRVSSGGRPGTPVTPQHTCGGVSAFLSWGYLVDSKGQVFWSWVPSSFDVCLWGENYFSCQAEADVMTSVNLPAEA